MFPTAHGVVSQGGQGAPPEPVEAYTYYRIVVSENHGRSTLWIPELTLLTTYPFDVIVGTPSASSELSISWPAAAAFDNSLSTAWIANTPTSYPQSLGLALASPQALGKYLLGSNVDAPDGLPKSWEVQGSNDGDAWTKLHEVLNAPVWAQSEWREYHVAGADQPGPFRYYRLDVAANNGRRTLGIAELELRATAGGSSIATGGTAASSSSFSGFPASNAFDGNASTFWSTQEDFPQGWLRYDLGAGNEQGIVEYAIRGRADSGDGSPKDWSLYGSHDGNFWIHLDSRSNQTGWSNGELRVFTI